MIEINHQLLVELGLGHLDERQQRALLRRIYKVLEARVGVVVGTSLTASQRATFEDLLEQNESQAQTYLAAVIPNFTVVVRNQLDSIATAIAASVDRGAVVIPDEVD